MEENMFTFPKGWEKVVYCKECRYSYTPIKVLADELVITARHCGIFKKIVRDNDYCSCGVRGDCHADNHD